MIFLISTMQIKPGTAQDCILAARPCLEATWKEPGCLSYDLHQSVSDPDTLVFVERWVDQAALDHHFKSDHLKEWRARASEFVLARKVEIIHPDTVEIL